MEMNGSSATDDSATPAAAGSIAASRARAISCGFWRSIFRMPAEVALVEYARGSPLFAALVARSKYEKMEGFGLAEKGRGRTSPNPLVGAVLVKASKPKEAELECREAIRLRPDAPTQEEWKAGRGTSARGKFLEIAVRELGIQPTSDRALGFNVGGELGLRVAGQMALARDVGGEVDREAEGVVELEHGLAVEQLLARGECRFEHVHAVFQRLGEALLLLPQDLRDLRARGRELGIGLAHRAIEILHQTVEERLLAAELVPVTNRAAHHPPEHIFTRATIGRAATRVTV